MLCPKQHGELVAELSLNLESVLTSQNKIEPGAGRGSLDNTLGIDLVRFCLDFFVRFFFFFYFWGNVILLEYEV